MTADDYFDAGNWHEFKEDYHKAVECYSKAIELQPHFPEAYFNRAGDYAMMEEFEHAIRDYEVAMIQSPEEPSNYTELSRLLLDEVPEHLRDPLRAVSLAWNACELSQYQDHDSLHVLARALATTGEAEEAVKWMTKSIKIIRGEIPVDPAYLPPVDGEIFLFRMQKELEEYKQLADSQGWFSKWKARLLGTNRK